MITSVKTGNNPPFKSWRHFLPGIINCISIFAFVLSNNAAGLYVPLYISRKLFPTRTVPISMGSICIVNETKLSPESEIIQEEAAMFSTYTTLASGIPAVVSSLFLGAFSDHFGRKIMFLTPMVGQLISKTILLFCVHYDLNINYILIGSFIEGVLGGYMTIFTASFAYIADITDNNKQRSAAIAFQGMSIGAGVVLGRFSSGYLIKATDYVWPQMIAVCGFTVIIFIIIFILPETRTSNNEQMITKRSCTYYLRSMVSFYISESNQGVRWKYNICILIFFATALTVIGKSSVDLLYQISQPFCWDSVKVGLYGALVGLLQNVICVGMIKVFHLCLSDEGVAILGSISGISAFVITALATTDITLYIAAVVGGGSVLAMPMIRGIMSRMTPPDKQGALFGGIAAVETACKIVGYGIFNSIYSNTVSFFKGTVYFVMAGTICIALLLLIVFSICSRQTPTYETMNEEAATHQTTNYDTFNEEAAKHNTPTYGTLNKEADNHQKGQ